MYTMMLERSGTVKKIFHPFSDKHRYTPSRGKAMSIGLGIKCKDGVVLAADTEMTIPYWFKYSESKIRILRNVVTPVFFAFASDDVPFCLMFIDRLAHSLQIDLINQSVQEIVKREAKASYSEYRPLFPDDNRFPQLLIVKQGANDVSLWNLSGGLSFHPVRQSACIGGGSAFALNLLQRLCRGKIMVKEALYIAAYVLSEVKNSGYSCGKDSQVLAIRPLNTRDNFNPLGFDVMQQKSVEDLTNAYTAALDALFPLLTTSEGGGRNEFLKKAENLKMLLQKNADARRTQVGVHEQRAIDEYLKDEPPEAYEREPYEDEEAGS